MFYEDHCKTKNQQEIFKALIELSKNGSAIAIQELDYLNIPRTELEETIMYFEKYGLFKNIHYSGNRPVFFSL